MNAADERLIPSAATVIDTFVSASIADSCRRWSGRPALSCSGLTLTYADLDAQASALAAVYRTVGIGAGDRLVCNLPSGPEHIIATVAAWGVGAVHVGAHPDLTGPELVAVATQTGASALLFQPRSTGTDPQAPLHAVRSARPGMHIIVHHHGEADGDFRFTAIRAAHPADQMEWSDHRLTDDRTAVLLRTSGTTGAPKAVAESLPALWAKAAFFASGLHAGPDDVHLISVPVAHAYGMTLVLCALATGGHLVFTERFSPEESLQLVGAHRVTVLPGTPTHFTLLLRALDPGRHRLDSLRWAVSAAAPLPASLADEIYARLGVEIMHVYGCSEGFLTMTTDREAIRLGSAGSGVFRGPTGTPPDGSVAILDVERDEPLPVGEVGEIAYGARRPVRYWGEPPVATHGWYRTGDLGRIDAEGRVFVSGRLKELINRGGLKVACSEIENAVRKVESVADCAVIPSPDPVLGEAICACVVPVAGETPTLEALRSQLETVLARHKLPDELCLLDVIPRTSLGKVDQGALHAHVVARGVQRTR